MSPYKFLLCNLANTLLMAKNDSSNSLTSMYGFAANTLLSRVYINMEYIKEWAVLDSDATSHFLVTGVPKCNLQPSINPLGEKIDDGV